MGQAIGGGEGFSREVGMDGGGRLWDGVIMHGWKGDGTNHLGWKRFTWELRGNRRGTAGKMGWKRINWGMCV